jgi:hypothetical protein
MIAFFENLDWRDFGKDITSEMWFGVGWGGLGWGRV